MITAILFDLDHTLSDRETAFRNFAVSQYNRFRKAFGLGKESDYVSALVMTDARGMRAKAVVYDEIAQLFSLTREKACDLYRDFEERIADFYVPFAGVHDTLMLLRQRGLKLGLVTNGRTWFQTRTIQKLRLGPFFDTLLISEAEGVKKPDPVIFERACNRLGIAPADAVFVGDNIDHGIRSAQRVGLRTAWKRSRGYAGPAVSDADFDELPELPALLSKRGARILENPKNPARSSAFGLAP